MNTAPVGTPTLWTQYVNNKDCSLGFCTLYCPQWCYIVFPPPPPFSDEFHHVRDSPGPNFSPLVITIIGILAASFLLLSYYAIISKYCIQRSTSTPSSTWRENESIGDNNDRDNARVSVSVSEPWFVTTNGLDDALIRSIAVFKYNKAEGLSQGTECCVCLNEFEERDSLRLLPKCSHAFHVACIDMWLKSHANCPLCRANVASIRTSESRILQVSPPEETLLGHGVSDNAEVDQNTSREIIASIDDIRDRQDDRDAHRYVRRSVSMDCIPDHRLSIGDAVGNQSRDLDRVMRRSHSSGRWFLCNKGRHINSVIPL